LVFGLCAGVAAQPKIVPVSLASRLLGDGSRSLLVLVQPASSAADEVRIELPSSAAGTAVLMTAPAGWQLQKDGRSIRMSGAPQSTAFRLRISTFDLPQLERARVRVRAQNRDIFDNQVAIAMVATLQTSATSAGFLALPLSMSPGETIEATVLDPSKTPMDGQWLIAGIPAEHADPDRLRVTLPTDLAAGSPVRITFFDLWGERVVDALSVDDVVVREPHPAPAQPRITGCAQYAFLGESVCVCGDFPEAARSAIKIDGQSATVTASSRHVLHLRLPDTLAPGEHTVSGDPAAGFNAAEAAKLIALRLRGSLDANDLLRGTSTMMRFAVDGTAEPMRLLVRNKTPGIITIPGGNYQELDTSGGAANGVERRVTGTGRGNFSIDYRLDAPPCPCAEPSQHPSTASRPLLVPRRVLATIAAGTPAAMLATAQAIALANGLSVAEVAPLPTAGVGLAVFEIVDGIAAIAKAAALAADPRVTLAQPDFVYDTSQGADTSLTYGPQMIGADIVQNVARGDGVRLAMIDAGVDTGHAALAKKVAEYADVTGTGWTPDAHGTLVAGVIAGESSGGIAPGVQLVTVKACVAQSTRRAAARCWSSTLARGIDFAAQKNVRVMNLSVGGPEDRLLARMVDAALKKGIAVVSAAGNDGPSGKPSFPAAFDDVIAVTAVDANGRLYSQATRGAFVDLAAPGVDILSTGPGGRTQLFSGTSAATAFASGAAALLLQQRSTLTAAELAALLRDTARDLGTGGRDAEYGDGLIDVCRAAVKLTNRQAACR
jgi:hypothetical protein